MWKRDKVWSFSNKHRRMFDKFCLCTCSLHQMNNRNGLHLRCSRLYHDVYALSSLEIMDEFNGNNDLPANIISWANSCICNDKSLNSVQLSSSCLVAPKNFNGVLKVDSELGFADVFVWPKVLRSSNFRNTTKNFNSRNKLWTLWPQEPHQPTVSIIRGIRGKSAWGSALPGFASQAPSLITPWHAILRSHQRHPFQHLAISPFTAFRCQINL